MVDRAEIVVGRGTSGLCEGDAEYGRLLPRPALNLAARIEGPERVVEN